MLTLSLMAAIALAEEPGNVSGTPFPGGAEVGVPALGERVLPWSEVGFAAAGPERPARGPEWPAFGPNGEVAFYDPVGHRVVIVDGPAIRVSRADDLVYGADGTLFCLDDDARMVTAYDASGQALGATSLPGIVPPGGRLGQSGGVLVAIDYFGNAQQVASWANGTFFPATKSGLAAPALSIRSQGGALSVDKRVIYRGEGRVSGRAYGRSILVEDRQDDGLSRVMVNLDSGAVEELPLEGRPYAPAREFAVSPDGRVLWMRPQADGLHLVEVR